MTVAECRALLSSADIDDLPRLIRGLASDDRIGVAEAVRSARGRVGRHRAEQRRVRAMYATEAGLREQGFACIAGVDEVGRGALAGPVTAGATVLAPDTLIMGLDDSKRLTPEAREEIAAVVKAAATAWSVAHVDATEIDKVGIVAATRRAMMRAIEGLGVAPDHVIVDGLGASLGPAETAIVGGDGCCAAIAAASIVAKVERDRLMSGLDSEHPGYGFAANKGYGTSEHTEAISTLGPSSVHRVSFAPCAETLRLF